jgi:4-oxalocrotonate tautomerase
MPFVSVKAIEGVFSTEQKQQIVQKITDVLVEIEGEKLRPITWVVIEEIKGGSWGIAGNCLNSEHVRAVQSGAVKLTDALGL